MVIAERSTGPAHPDRDRRLPGRAPRVSFVGIGAQKCATTWLHDILAQHPGVSLPTGHKEVDFFSQHYDFGFQWYERRFTGDPERLAGEISPSYLHSPGAPERVAQYNPDMRLILIVREPVARAISNHKHEVRIGHFTGDDLSFEAGLANNPSYVEQGRYAKHLRNWLKVFPRDNVLVLDFDAVIDDPAGVMQSVCRFLGLADLPAGVDLHGKSNESYLVRSGTLEKLKNGLRGVARSLHLGGAWSWLGDTGLRSRYRRANRVSPEAAIGRPLPETVAALKALFRDDIDELERLTGQSFHRWR